MTAPAPYPPSPVAPATGKKLYAGRKVPWGVLFLTANTYRRMPVFSEPVLCQLFFRELHFYRAKFGFQLYAYVLLPDHFHLLISFPPQQRLRDFLRDFKSTVGRLVIDWLKEKQKSPLLARLRLAVQPKRRRDPCYCVLQSNSYVRPVLSAAMFKQKLDYIHANPVRERLVSRPVDYPYSSLRNYLLGEGPISIDAHNLLLGN